MNDLAREFKDQHPWSSVYFSEEAFLPNLEQLLTKLHLEREEKYGASDNTTVEARLCDVTAFLNEKLRLERIANSQLEKAAFLCSALFTRQDTIITFNYDCLLEHVLWKLKVWSPNGGYGRSPNLNDLARYGCQIDTNFNEITILKLHSSLNFEALNTDNDVYLQAWVSDKLFPGINACWNEEAPSPPIVLPSFVKIFGESRTLMYLWHEAIEKIKRASTIIVIGYSLPRSDSMTRFLLSFISADKWKNRDIGKLRIGILNKGTSASGLRKQMIEVGQFREENVESLVLDEASDHDYDTLCSWSRE